MISRRTFLEAALKATAVAGFPGIIRSQDARPATPQGVASGDVTGGRAVIWSRADRAARMFVEYATTERFENPLRVPGQAALETSDYTARVVLTDLPPG